MKLKHDLLLRTARGEQTERPPVWLMRQAGRILPQYRAIRSRLSGFIELVTTPELAAEVTIQPVDELGVDAAILFSDILVVPEAMGLPYELVEKVGPRFPQTIKTSEDIERLQSGSDAAERLGYVYDAIQCTTKALDGRVPLIGFAGAPWTLMAYMIEGGGSKTFSKARGFLYQEPHLAHRLMEKISETIIQYIHLQVGQGIHLVQLFDSWAGHLHPIHYQEFVLPYVKEICKQIQAVPLTFFAKGAPFLLDEMEGLDCAVVGLDWMTNPKEARNRVGTQKVLQGNMDPCQLYAENEEVQAATQSMLASFGRQHIANLGHGVYPDTPLEQVKTFVNTVKAFRYPDVS